MKAVSKTLIACAISAASVFSAANASAAPFNPFTVDRGDGTTFVADKMVGSYTEVISFNADNTFDVSLYTRIGQFANGGGTGPISGEVTGVDRDYSLYALYSAKGTYQVGATTTFAFTPGTGSLAMYLDTQNDSQMTTLPTDGTGAFTITNSGNDTLIATGAALTGEGWLIPSAGTCGQFGINCGSFGSTTEFNLNADGAAFFVSPSPFYNLSFQSGQLNNFDVEAGTTQIINGSMDIVFSRAAEVPEPASVGLLGLGMLGLYAARRRNGKKAA